MHWLSYEGTSLSFKGIYCIFLGDVSLPIYPHRHLRDKHFDFKTCVFFSSLQWNRKFNMDTGADTLYTLLHFYWVNEMFCQSHLAYTKNIILLIQSVFAFEFWVALHLPQGSKRLLYRLSSTHLCSFSVKENRGSTRNWFLLHSGTICRRLFRSFLCQLSDNVRVVLSNWGRAK